MKIVRNILLITLAFLIQATLFGRFDLFGVRPDLVMITLIFLAGETEPVGLIWYGFFMGFLQDVYSPEYLGFNTFSMSMMAFILGVIRDRLTVENYTVKLFTTLFACMVHDAVYYTLYTRFELPVMVSLFVRDGLPGAVYTAVLAVLLVSIWNRVQSGGVFFVVREIMGNR